MTEATITYSDGYTRTLAGVDAEDVVFTTPHGSRLYGLDHKDSDYDGMVVYRDARNPVHKKVGEEDTIHVGFVNLLAYAASGSHQYLEGLFSQQKTWYAEEYRPIVAQHRVPIASIRVKYERTIKKFCFGTEKQRRHAVRLAFFVRDLEYYGGWADPTLDPGRVEGAQYFGSAIGGDNLFDLLLKVIH